MSRIATAFRAARQDGRVTLVAFLMAGDPDLASTEAFALACERGGADVLELGVPFSDPIADGPVIRRAGERALRAGTGLSQVLDFVARLRPQIRMPIVAMTYLSPILAMRLETFAAKAQAAGLDGLIVPDLSLEDSDDVRASMDAVGVDYIQLVAPATPPERARAIANASRGFLYVVARYGTTGVRADLPGGLGDRLDQIRRTSPLPLAVGFGVSSPDQARSIADLGADGVVVGSAIVQRIAEDPDPTAVQRFVGELASALRARAVTSPVPRGSSP